MSSLPANRYTLRPGDVFWTGVGWCTPSTRPRGAPRALARDIGARNPHTSHSYRFNRDWDYLQERLDETGQS